MNSAFEERMKTRLLFVQILLIYTAMLERRKFMV
jgi:hypothetical protein